MITLAIFHWYFLSFSPLSFHYYCWLLFILLYYADYIFIFDYFHFFLHCFRLLFAFIIAAFIIHIFFFFFLSLFRFAFRHYYFHFHFLSLFWCCRDIIMPPPCRWCRCRCCSFYAHMLMSWCLYDSAFATLLWWCLMPRRLRAAFWCHACCASADMLPAMPMMLMPRCHDAADFSFMLMFRHYFSLPLLADYFTLLRLSSPSCLFHAIFYFRYYADMLTPLRYFIIIDIYDISLNIILMDYWLIFSLYNRCLSLIFSLLNIFSSTLMSLNISTRFHYHWLY